MDLICGACGEDEVINISTFGDPDVRYMCSLCGSQDIREVMPKRRPEGYQPPSVSQMARRLRATEQHLEPSAMQRAIANESWEEDAERWRDDLVALLDELDPE